MAPLPVAPPAVVPHRSGSGTSAVPWYADLLTALGLLALEVVAAAGCLYVVGIEGWAYNADYGGRRDAPPPPDTSGQLMTCAAVLAAVALVAAVSLAFARAFITVVVQGLVAACLGLALLAIPIADHGGTDSGARPVPVRTAGDTPSFVR
ncbi:hypothetical protein FGW37_29720 [Streptomyces rectiverticillatus]|uniref:DUF6234 family protein n=1 Tax=Streptomyces rectiverticillatus TaxID=173860 RepID=UPI0015C3131D|nr:DUF6234 family protein [Streptomyces rectiverticillatus]QLE75226.1 hypothetical protein FGW37_29720 [Streptomyces rectiverticillatus]